MIVDTSALIAILRNEPEIAIFSRAIVAAPVSRISAGTLQELGIVINRYRDPNIIPQLESYLDVSHIIVEPVTVALARQGWQAYQKFGKGSGHPAKLNFVDCFWPSISTNRSSSRATISFTPMSASPFRPPDDANDTKGVIH